MDFKIVFKKAGLAILTFVISMLVANTDLLVGLLPENIANMTVGGIVAGIIVGVTNWLKNRIK